MRLTHSGEDGFILYIPSEVYLTLLHFILLRTLFKENHCIKLPLRFRQVFYLFVSVALFSFVIYLRKIILLKICILYCLVSLNIVLFKPCLF